jgi:hypothetical protein
MPDSSERDAPSSDREHVPARVVFLGGVGEVGRNMACVELDGRILIVDVGLSFPHAEMPGIDLVLPDFEYIRDRPDDVEAVVLTTGTRTTSARCRSCCASSMIGRSRSTGRRSRSRCWKASSRSTRSAIVPSSIR